ncbi:MAG: CDGSH iron-sulfur domain-containing protein [Acidobacteriota bacterium]|jgi:CDGSH-type Zn-finger protein
MSDPVVASRKSVRLTLTPGTYWWCSCGRSASQPFCDGSHKGTEFSPLQFEVEREREVFLCQCKHTRTPPHCDGSHKALPQA